MFQLDYENGIARLTLAHAPVNAMSVDWISGFHDELDRLAQKGDWRMLHIRSMQKIFSAGADLAEIRARFESADGAGEMIAYVENLQALFARIEALPQITIAEISGAALGGGFELTLVCDFRVAANEAKLGLPEVNLGLIPGAGGTQRLSRLVGLGLATRLILGAEVVTGEEAAALGMVQWAVPRDGLAGAAEALIARLAKLSPAAQAATKGCIQAAYKPGIDGFAVEREAVGAMMHVSDTKARVGGFLAGQRR